MNRFQTLFAIAATSLLIAACGEKSSKAAPSVSATPTGTSVASAAGFQTLEAGCAGCVFHMPGAEGCQLAVKIDGKPYLVTGFEMPGHESGLCDRSRMAEIKGQVEGDQFVAKSFALKP